MIDQFEILTTYEDLVAGGRDRFFQAEEFRLGREIDRTGAAAAADCDLVLTVANDGTGNLELGRGAERIIRGDLFRGDRLSVYQQLVAHVRLNLTRDAEVVIQRHYHDRRIASVAPLRAATILDQPVGNRFDQSVLGIDFQQRPQRERSGFDAAVGPTPVDTIFAPVRRADYRRIGSLRASLDNRDVRYRVDLHTIFQILDQRFRLIVVAEPMRGKRQQRPRVGVELVPAGPEVLKGFRLKLTNLSLLSRR